MSAFRGNADAFSCSPTCTLMTPTGHSNLVREAEWPYHGLVPPAAEFDGQYDYVGSVQDGSNPKSFGIYYHRGPGDHSGRCAVAELSIWFVETACRASIQFFLPGILA